MVPRRKNLTMLLLTPGVAASVTLAAGDAVYRSGAPDQYEIDPVAL